MERRDLLKSFLALPLMPHIGPSGVEGAGTELKGRQFVVFFDMKAVNYTALNSLIPPDGATITFVGVKLPSGKNIDDVVKIYRIDEEGAGHGESLDAKSFVGNKA